MSCRTALCGVLQNEQRHTGLLKKSNNESSRFTHIARSRQKDVLDSAFALARRIASLGPLQRKIYIVRDTEGHPCDHFRKLA